MKQFEIRLFTRPLKHCSFGIDSDAIPVTAFKKGKPGGIGERKTFRIKFLFFILLFSYNIIHKYV